MFERFTERTRRVLFLARHEASALGSQTIEPAHLLLGLLREGKGFTRPVLDELGDSEDLIQEIQGHAISGPVFPRIEVPFGLSTHVALACAAHEADSFSHLYIGTAHLLLGILTADNSMAADILYGRGLRVETLRKRIAEAFPPSTIPGWSG